MEQPRLALQLSPRSRLPVLGGEPDHRINKDAAAGESRRGHHSSPTLRSPWLPGVFCVSRVQQSGPFPFALRSPSATMRIMPWLHFKDGVARVRRVVPVRLRPFFNGKTTITKSLRTGDAKVAQSRALKVAQEIDGTGRAATGSAVPRSSHRPRGRTPVAGGAAGRGGAHSGGTAPGRRTT